MKCEFNKETTPSDDSIVFSHSLQVIHELPHTWVVDLDFVYVYSEQG